MKEHSGGTPEVGFISVSDWDEESFTVPIEHFDFSGMDNVGQFVAEIVKRGEDCTSFIEAIAEKRAGYITASKVASLLDIMITSSNPRMAAHQIVWATGMTLLDGASIVALAKKYGVSKQAFEQGALRICAKLALKPCRNMRDDIARKNMSKRNKRQTK